MLKYRYCLVKGVQEIYNVPSEGMETLDNLVVSNVIRLPKKYYGSLPELCDDISQKYIFKPGGYMESVEWRESSYTEDGLLHLWVTYPGYRDGTIGTIEDARKFRRGEKHMDSIWYELDIECEKYTGWDFIPKDEMFDILRTDKSSTSEFHILEK